MIDEAHQLFELYAGLDRAHGVYAPQKRTDQKGKLEGRAQTVLEPMTPSKWLAHLKGEKGVGIIPIRDDSTVVWGAIDIDVYPLDLDDLFARVVRFDLPVVVLRTKSGGAHVTCFASEPVPAKLMRSKLMEMAVALGYPGVEIYPKQVSLAGERDVGNWLNMPYYDAEKTTRYAVNKGNQLSLCDFLRYAHSIRVTHAELTALKIELGPDFNDGPPCLQLMAMQGLEAGTRNDAMFAFGVYCRNKYGDGWEAEFEKLNNSICQPPLPSREIVTLSKSLSRKEYFYPCKRRPCAALCNKELCKTREFGIGGQKDEVNVMIGNLVKINHADHPTWIIDVDGVRFELETDDLLSQSRFHKVCVSKTNKWPSTVKPFVWQTLINEKLANVEIVDPPEDSSTAGRFAAYLEQFCTTVALAHSQDELLLGKPWVDKGVTWFRSNDLMDYLERQHFRGFTQRDAWNALRHIGATHQQFHIKGRCVQCWGVKEFARQSSAFELPPWDNPEI